MSVENSGAVAQTRAQVLYEWSRYHSVDSDECDDIEEAIGRALADMESGEAWPCRILSGEAVLWEESGPITTGHSLESFAKANGVEAAK